MKKINFLAAMFANAEEKKVFPKEDIDLLAAMCSCCTVVTKPRRFFRSQEFLYYVPSSESYIDVAKYLFAKHGLEMHVHHSKILGGPGQKVLRTNYDNISEKADMSGFISQIQKRRSTICAYRAIEERKALLQKAEAMIKQK